MSEQKWVKINSMVKWDRWQYEVTYLLCHEDLSYSLGKPYDFIYGIGMPKMSVTHYCELPNPPDDV